MKRTILAAALAGIALVSFEARAQAVTPKSVQFGVAAGAAIPSGDLSSGVNTGFTGTGIIGFSPALKARTAAWPRRAAVATRTSQA